MIKLIEIKGRFFMKKYLFYHFPWQLLLVAITIQSSFDTNNLIDLGFTFQDKFLHFMVFGFLAFLMARSFKISKFNLFNRYYHVMAILFTAFYGVLDEYHQYYVPGRFSTIGDWLADILGAIVFIVIYYYWERWNYLKA
jgi:VanZ family protein